MARTPLADFFNRPFHVHAEQQPLPDMKPLIQPRDFFRHKKAGDQSPAMLPRLLFCQ
jgi:hypothetical protein